MEDNILLAHLKALLNRAPDFGQYAATSQEHLTWLAQAYALTAIWNRLEAVALQTAADFLTMELTREQNIAKIFNIVHRAIASLEMRVPDDEKMAFGAGDVYDFFNAFRRVVSSASSDLLIVDPYIDASTIETYVESCGPDVGVRIILNRYANDAAPAVQRFNDQHGPRLAARQTTAIHDRVVFVDREVCWVLGASIKDAAKAKPTYLVSLPPDVSQEKLRVYEEIWHDAAAI